MANGGSELTVIKHFYDLGATDGGSYDFISTRFNHSAATDFRFVFDGTARKRLGLEMLYRSSGWQCL